MLVDSDGRFISQREQAMLARLIPRIHGSELTVTAENGPTFEHDIAFTGDEITVGIWSDQVLAVDQGEQAARWFSDFLGSPTRLVGWGSQSRRVLDPQWVPGPNNGSTFTDAYPVLAVLQSSLDDLNQRLIDPVPMNRFRPNIVISGGEPWSEDAWQAVRIGPVTFDAVKPCARCVVTTTDQFTGDRHPRQEPLRTLASFRTIRGLGAIFGQNMVHRSRGTITTGDPVAPLIPAS